MGSQDSSVSIAAGYKLDIQVSTSSRHPASYPVCSIAISPGVKQVWHEADHSSSSIADVKNGGTIHPLPHA
jgi:hypothetical protein